ncbi:MAG: polyhydroxyalkanoic acid system family protein [Xanthomonadales bacterium]|jgi:putative polyhydroxyalkanoate system protein|nr:polyhydroxyalkanoic acid system family protein [Xanthomonadales bacterium]
MASIDLSRSHSLGQSQAREKADELAAELSQQFDFDHSWEGDIMHFERPGVNGTIEVSASSIRVCADLSLFLMALKPTIQNEINRYLEKHFQ